MAYGLGEGGVGEAVCLFRFIGQACFEVSDLCLVETRGGGGNLGPAALRTGNRHSVLQTHSQHMGSASGVPIQEAREAEAQVSPHKGLLHLKGNPSPSPFCMNKRKWAGTSYADSSGMPAWPTLLRKWSRTFVLPCGLLPWLATPRIQGNVPTLCCHPRYLPSSVAVRFIFSTAFLVPLLTALSSALPSSHPSVQVTAFSVLSISSLCHGMGSCLTAAGSSGPATSIFPSIWMWMSGSH